MPATMLRWLSYIGAVTLLLLAFVAAEILLEQPMGLFSGSLPADLGFHSGKFKACPRKPNCVSSTTDAQADAVHHIAPLRISGSASAAWQRLGEILAASPRAKLITQQPDYLHAEFKSARMGFVDDVEFALDANTGVIHVRSAARLGVRDFGVNRERIERIRRELAGT
jgi:uncharacterized protein (DUF1499 family)